MRILVTGGLGYIGSHTVIQLVESGHEVTILDNLSNSSINVLSSIKKITGSHIPFLYIDLSNQEQMEELKSHRFDAIVHFAALKSVEESVNHPLKYYENNVSGLINLLKFAQNYGIKKFVFSSSCSVYGDGVHSPVKESVQFGETKSPYANTKIICENILDSIKDKLTIISLRYFNPIGAHPSLMIGETTKKSPSNIIPILCECANGIRDEFNIYGSDYDTEDGTCIRDYIDVNDLAFAHVLSLTKENSSIYNVGTGEGKSVKNIIDEFKKINSVDFLINIKDRRSGDVSAIWADNQKIFDELGWKPTRTIEDSLRSAFLWSKKQLLDEN